MGLASLLHFALSGLSGKIHVAFVFGSMASGQQKAGSDIDVLEEHETNAEQVCRMLDSAGSLLCQVSDWLSNNKPELTT
jgi:predicted nucleotidyltransferase